MCDLTVLYSKKLLAGRIKLKLDEYGLEGLKVVETEIRI
jgi:hypothetical protein